MPGQVADHSTSCSSTIQDADYEGIRIRFHRSLEKAIIHMQIDIGFGDAIHPLTLWHEVEPELSELDEYGGGDYSLMEDVGEGLYQLYKKLQEITLTEEDRGALLNEVVSYIESGNEEIKNLKIGIRKRYSSFTNDPLAILTYLQPEKSIQTMQLQLQGFDVFLWML